MGEPDVVVPVIGEGVEGMSYDASGEVEVAGYGDGSGPRGTVVGSAEASYGPAALAYGPGYDAWAWAGYAPPGPVDVVDDGGDAVRVYYVAECGSSSAGGTCASGEAVESVGHVYSVVGGEYTVGDDVGERGPVGIAVID